MTLMFNLMAASTLCFTIMAANDRDRQWSASGTSSLKIGRTSTGSYFNGLVDEVRVSNTAVYTGNFTPQMHLTAGVIAGGLHRREHQRLVEV